MCKRPNYIVDGKFFPHDSYYKFDTLTRIIAVPIPCGNCIECMKDYTNEWVYRVMSEYKGVGCVLTLTYDPEHLPDGANLSRRHLQLFLKRLRKKIFPVKIRYFGCGEYGTLNYRPHYHLIILGWQPNDLDLLKSTKKGTVLYRSRFINEVWGKGICAVARVNEESIRYSCKYMQKLFFQKNLDGRVPPFTCMSTHPGFGFHESLKYLKNDSVYLNGKRRRLPRYYLKVAERFGLTQEVEEIKKNRVLMAKAGQFRRLDSQATEEDYFLRGVLARIALTSRKDDL